MLCQKIFVCWLLFMIFLPVSIFSQKRLLSVEDIFHPEKKLDIPGESLPDIHWLADGAHYLQWCGEWRKVNARTGVFSPFYEANRVQQALVTLGISPKRVKWLLRQGQKFIWNSQYTAFIINEAKDLFYCLPSEGIVRRLTKTPEEEKEVAFSPDGRWVSFVRNHNLYVLEIETLQEKKLTSDGSEKILNGILDWVYQEEIYGRGNFRGYWWSPDSHSIAFLQLDISQVLRFTLIDHIPYLLDVEVMAYPKAGTPNPLAKLGIVHLKANDLKWVEKGDYSSEILYVNVCWAPDGKALMYQVQNREQTWLDLNQADPVTGKFRTLFRETSPAWVETIGSPYWLKDGSFLWLSERNGWKHLYHYNPHGCLIQQITKGHWEVRELYGVDEENGIIYFAATEYSHLAEHIYRLRMKDGEMVRISTKEGNHKAVFNPYFTMYLDYQSDVVTPPYITLQDSWGKDIRDIYRAENKIILSRPEFSRIQTQDGFILETMMIRPPDFQADRKYPVLCFVYGGPHYPIVQNKWGKDIYLWHQMLAQRGYIVWSCDNRTASGKGAASTWKLYPCFGPLELQDIEEGVAWLKSQKYVDSQRIGIWGWSFGGYTTCYAMTHSKSFRAGIAVAPVTDWRNYDTIYTERYMKTPQQNPEGYQRSSPVHAAKNIHGRLLLIHGMMDDNVHMQNTIQFVYELQKAGKQFDLMLYPKSRHGIEDPKLRYHLFTLMTEFLLRNL